MLRPHDAIFTTSSPPALFPTPGAGAARFPVLQVKSLGLKGSALGFSLRTTAGPGWEDGPRKMWQNWGVG